MGARDTTRREFLKSISLGAAALAAPGGGCLVAGPDDGEGGSLARLPARGQTASRSRPNILFVVADDLGWGDVGYHGSAIMTPNIDRLAEQGVVFDQHYVCPMCTPTRTALLTGRYPSRWGNHAVKPCNERVLPFGAETLASVLKGAGYDTGLSGKWHLGSKPEWGPNHFGFNRSYGSLAGGVGPYNHLYKRGPYSRTWHRDGKLLDEEGHVTDLLGREVVGWIKERREPWFYYVAFTAVHVPVKAPDRYIDMYAGRVFYEDARKDESFRRYAAYATQMDDWIGRMLRALDETGQRGNTVVVFTSDNGSFPSWKNRRYPGRHPDCPVLGSNEPLRGYKGQVYEGGIRVPTVASWPGRLTPAKVTAPVHIVDWMPTLTGLVGCRPGKDPKWDGVDIWPLVTGRATGPAQRTMYWPFINGAWAVRRGDWKLLCPGKNRPPELYNLAEDPYETKNVAARYPDRLAELQRVLGEHRELDVEKRPPDPPGA